jgi:signal transduction histidine kinase/CheY-like chemotaxis protein
MKDYKGIFWKVVSGFAITACLLAIAYWITYDNLNTLKSNLDTLTELNPKYVYRKDIIREVEETERFVKKYTINKNREFLYQCDSSIDAIGEDIYQLQQLSGNDPEYYENLERLNAHINEKLSVARQRIELASAYSSGKELSAAIKRISVPEKKSILPVSEEQRSPEKKNFFSRLFSRERSKAKVIPDTISFKEDTQAEMEFSAGYMKEMLQQAEQKETEKSNQYLRENLLLIDKDDRIHDKIRAVSTALEKLEIEESVVKINRLTEETTNKAGNILSSLLIIGILSIFVFTIIVYREVRFNEKLQKELIREKKSTEKLAKAKEEFLANMSHEIRTPMNVIMGFSDQLLKTNLSNEQQKFLFNIKSSSKHLITVINEILDYSKMESGVITLENIPFSVREVIEDVQVAFKNTADKKGIELNYVVDDVVAGKVIGDPVRLKQILLNLTGNAIKFTEKGKVDIKCFLWSSDEQSQTLLIEVEDTGIGIPEDAQKMIFEQFTQADSSVTRKYGGTGLGLAISKKLVELHNGEIAVRSEQGIGAVFYFKIRYDLPAFDNNEQVLPSKEVKNTHLLEGKRILIADDDEMNKFLAQHILETYKVDVDTAANGKEALEKILNEYFDVVLMDLHMPEMSGIDVVLAIRNKDIDVPVIAITGNVLKSERDKCISAGMSEYISKPYEENELLLKIINQLPTI